MEGLHFKLIRTPEEASDQLDACKLLGSPVMPANYLESLNLEEGDYFVGQIWCDALPVKNPLFPQKGFLYFFVNIDSLTPRVFYTKKDPAEVIDGMNEQFDADSCGDPTCLKMEFVDDPELGSYVFGPVDPNMGLEMATDTNGKVVLLQIDSLEFSEKENERPLTFGVYGFSDHRWVFLIDEADLKKGRFDRVELVESES